MLERFPGFHLDVKRPRVSLPFDWNLALPLLSHNRRAGKVKFGAKKHPLGLSRAVWALAKSLQLPGPWLPGVRLAGFLISTLVTH